MTEEIHIEEGVKAIYNSENQQLTIVPANSTGFYNEEKLRAVLLKVIEVIRLYKPKLYLSQNTEMKRHCSYLSICE